jgi:hypothetical protein
MGVPHAIASIITSPNGSGLDRKQQGRGAREKLLLGFIIDFTGPPDGVAIDVGLETLLAAPEISALAALIRYRLLVENPTAKPSASSLRANITATITLERMLRCGDRRLPLR